MLDTLRPTAAGLDGLPAWLLGVAATVLCKLTAHIFDISLSTSTCSAATVVPGQWKEARIQPIPSRRSCAALLLPSDIGDAHPADQNDGACCRPGVSVYVISHTAAVAYILRSICLSPYWFHFRRCHITTSHHHYPPTF